MTITIEKSLYYRHSPYDVKPTASSVPPTSSLLPVAGTMVEEFPTCVVTGIYISLPNTNKDSQTPGP